LLSSESPPNPPPRRRKKNAMADKDIETDEFVGCMGAIWYLVVILPMWMILLYQILVSIEAPAYAWILFWMYLPAQVIGAVFVHTAKIMAVRRKKSA
jgi:cation transport ATPase